MDGLETFETESRYVPLVTAQDVEADPGRLGRRADCAAGSRVPHHIDSRPPGAARSQTRADKRDGYKAVWLSSPNPGW